MMQIKKLAKPSRMYKEVADQLEEAIISGEIKPGEKLPNERSIAKAFGVSQHTVREALRILEEKGMIQTSQTGNIVLDLSNKKITQNMSRLMRAGKVTWSEVFEFREDVFPLVIVKAAKKANPEHIKKMEESLQGLRAMLDQKSLDIQKYRRAEHEFHLLFADSIQNPLYLWFEEAILDSIFPHFLASCRKEKVSFFRKELSTLEDIVQAIKERNPRDAYDCALRHLAVFKHFELILVDRL